MYLPTHLCVCLSVCLFVCLFVSINLSIYQSISLSIYQSIYLSIYGPGGGRQPPPPPPMVSPPRWYMYICIYTWQTYMCIYIFRYICIPLLHTYIHTCMPIPTNLRRYIHTTPNPPHRGGGEAEVPCMIVGFQGGSTPNPRNHPHRIHTYVRTYIHTCLYLPTYVGTYILHPTHTYIHTCLYLPTYVGTCIHASMHPCIHPSRGGGEAEVPCMIVGFQGGSTPNPRNHPITYRIHTYMPIPTNLRRYIHTTPNPPHRGGRGSRGTLHDSWIPGR